MDERLWSVVPADPPSPAAGALPLGLHRGVLEMAQARDKAGRSVDGGGGGAERKAGSLPERTSRRGERNFELATLCVGGEGEALGSNTAQEPGDPWFQERLSSPDPR